jgi:glycyl-tRNA synthetase
VRPDDGRYGENPNRLQQHTQFQVILKPDPGNPQELYLRSLEAIGIDIHKHDIRFVEDNWASPALGAWGLGWEVWLDGLEITQFTYFQQAGGLTLDPVSVEITYGLDRIAMALQGARYVGDVRWSPQHSWGDLLMQGEREHSTYYFEIAHVERLRQMYDMYEAEGLAALEAGLVLPAYDYALKCSHTFNVLDTRGAIGVTERQAYFRRMRKLSGAVAEAYVALRQKEEYPWLEEGEAASGEAKPAIATGPDKAADFLLEIGTEELPPADLDSALHQLSESLSQRLKALNLEHGAIQVLGTPRRLVAQVAQLAARQADRDEVVKGPPAERAFDADGKPTKAAEGFARGQGVDVADLQTEEMDGGEYVVARVHQTGRPAAEVLAEALPELIADLKFERSMRWNASGAAFSRPVRWLLALHGEHVLPFSYAGLQSGAASRGLRLSADEHFEAKSPKDYLNQLGKRGILLDPEERRAAIEEQIQALAKEAGGQLPVDPGLLDEVANLVEAPHALLGEFEASFLDLPREVLIAVMKKHQRYFPVARGDKLLNRFIVVANGAVDAAAVIEGNADVIRARFADAAYFIKKDRQRKLADFVADLKGLTFQADLGSMYDKTQRLTKLVDEVAKALDLNKEETQSAQRAAELAKADLATSMVVEMTSLQGVMGRYYALDSGEPDAVAAAIDEHYAPRSAGDPAPASKAGLTLGIADRLDTLTGLFAVGLAPTGAKDPFAQRRAAIGLVQSLIDWDVDFDLRQGVAWAAELQPVKVSEEAQAETLDFIVGRLRALLLERELRYDVVDAVLAEQGAHPAQAAAAAAQLAGHLEHKAWPDVLDTFARCVRITRDLDQTQDLNDNIFVEEAEKSLYSDLQKAESAKPFDGSMNKFMQAFMPIMPAIKRFFDDVLVMAEDEAVKRNRLALLQRVARLADGVADFSKMEGF